MTDETDVKFELPEKIDVTVIEEVYSSLNNIISSDKKIILDASKVEKITTPGVQLLLSAARSMGDNSGNFCINNPSENFINVFSDLGLSSQLNKWTEK